MPTKLAEKECKACDGQTPRLQGEPLRKLREELDGDWNVVDEQRLERQYKFEDFAGALEFTNRVGAIAEQQGHHPGIFLTYGEVKIQIWTHKVGGLTESDFILAAKINSLN
jgi:4a-hydroxytetrahydrobiopterin dehydratase